MIDTTAEQNKMVRRSFEKIAVKRMRSPRIPAQETQSKRLVAGSGLQLADLLVQLRLLRRLEAGRSRLKVLRVLLQLIIIIIYELLLSFLVLL